MQASKRPRVEEADVEEVKRVKESVLDVFSRRLYERLDAKADFDYRSADREFSKPVPMLDERNMGWYVCVHELGRELDQIASVILGEIEKSRKAKVY